MTLLRSKSRLFYGIAAFCVLLLAAELFSGLSLSVLKEHLGYSYSPVDQLNTQHKETFTKWMQSSDSSYLSIDSDHGWTISTNIDTGLYQSNAQGFRASREYDKVIPSGKLRIAAFGDSYTHGDGVANGETWPAMLELGLKRMEVLNFGVSGYDIGQSYLRYQAAAENFEMDIVLIGFMSKDIEDVVSRFRPFQLPTIGLPFAKPRFRLRDHDHLELLPNPLPDKAAYTKLLTDPNHRLQELGQGDFYYQRKPRSSIGDLFRSVRLFKVLSHEWDRRARDYGMLKNGLYSREHEAYQLSLEILKRFAQSVQKDEARPIILFLPNREDIERANRQEAPQYAPLVEDLQKEGYEVIDPQAAFAGIPLDDVNTGHYTPLGNRQVAEFLSKFFKLPTTQ